MKLFDTAHIVKKITVETELGEWREPHGVTNSVVHMDGKTPGWFITRAWARVACS